MKYALMKLLSMCGVVFLAACGGSSDDPGSSPTPNPGPSPNPDPVSETRTGVFVDSPVVNIGYRTETHEGVTNGEGEYEYEAGETVTFFIGDLEFPPTAANGIVTPLDIAGTTDTNDNKVINMVRLLQSLDTDGDLSSIDIGDSAADMAAPVTDPVAFFSQSVDDFANDGTVTNLVINAGQPTGLVSVEDAKSHLESSLEDQEVAFTKEGGLTGGWLLDTSKETGNGTEHFIFLAFDEKTGNYFHVETKEFEDETEEGMEYGAFNLDSAGVLNVTGMTFDQNGGIGLHDPEDGVGSVDAAEYITFEPTGTTGSLGIYESNGELIESIPTSRVEADGLHGTWVFDDPDNEYGLLVFVFMADGTYVHAELKHERDYEDEWDGAEYGSYSYDGTLTAGELTEVTPELDTNGTAGIDLDDIAVDYDVSGNTMSLTITVITPGVDEEDAVMNFTRLGAGGRLGTGSSF